MTDKILFVNPLIGDKLPSMAMVSTIISLHVYCFLSDQNRLTQFSPEDKQQPLSKYLLISHLSHSFQLFFQSYSIGKDISRAYSVSLWGISTRYTQHN